MSSVTIHFQLIIFGELECLQRIVADRRTWRIHLMHSSKHACETKTGSLQGSFCWDVLQWGLMAAQICSLTRTQPSDWEAPKVFMVTWRLWNNFPTSNSLLRATIRWRPRWRRRSPNDLLFTLLSSISSRIWQCLPFTTLCRLKEEMRMISENLKIWMKPDG